MEQLHKLPAKISLLALMLNSEPHREAVLKILKQAYVPHNASVDKIDCLVSSGERNDGQLRLIQG